MIKRLSLFFLPVLLYSSVIINDPYRYEVLNSELKNLGEIISIDILDKMINEQLGYRLDIQIYEVDRNKKIFVYGKKLTGDLINELFREYDIAVDVDKKRMVIYIRPEHTFHIDLPYDWDTVETVKALSFAHQDVTFKHAGNRIYAYGNKEAISRVKETMESLEYTAKRAVGFRIIVYPYESKTRAYRYVSYLNNSFPYRKEMPLIISDFKIRHGDVYAFNFKDTAISIKYNAVTDSLIFDDALNPIDDERINVIPVDSFNDLGYVFTGRDGQKYIAMFKKLDM